MPEGDTIHRAASRIRAALAGRAIVGYRGPRLGVHAPERGTVVEDVAARGKFLLIRFDDGTTLETHMRMTGSWHLYRRGERWRRGRSTARVVIETDAWIAVCFAAPHAELRSTAALDRALGRAADGPDTSATERGRPPMDPRRAGPERLGPDLTAEDPDLGEVVARIGLLATPGTPVVTVLLDQRLFAGVGNVFKSEVLFACNLHPETPIGTVDASTRRHLAEVAHRQLRANLGPGPRTTVPGGLAVYGRAGRPCRRCATPIEYGRHGPHARSTYWCPRCQPVPEPGTGGGPQPAPGRTTPDS